MMFLLILQWNRHSFTVKSSEILKYICVIVIFIVLILGNTEIKNNLSNRFIEGIKFHDSFQKNRVGGDRILLWKSSIVMIKDHPIFGVGLHNFNKVYNEDGYIDKSAKEPELASPHNIFLHFFVETGLLGGIAFCTLIFYQLFYTWKNAKNDNFVLAYFLAILGMCIHGMVDYIFTIKVYYQLYWLLCSAVWLHVTVRKYLFRLYK